MNSVEQTLARTLENAALFAARHSTDPSVGPTYGYFTSHPVAPLNKKRLKLMLEKLQLRSQQVGGPLRVLDLACGGGLITCSVAELGHRVLGLDLSAQEIRLANLFAREQKLGGSFWQADLMADAKWEKTVEDTLGGKPHVVLLAYALHHFPQVEPFVERLGRWLDPGAQLLINEENPRSPMFRLKHVVRSFIQKDTETEWHRSYEGWKSLLEKSGFKLDQPLLGADPLVGLSQMLPSRCWSLVFVAERS